MIPKLSFLQKLVFAFAWRKARAYVQSVPILAASPDVMATADALDSKTVTTASWAVAGDLAYCIARVTFGDMSVADAGQHAILMLLGLAACFLRHALARYQGQVQDQLNQIKSRLPVPCIALLLLLPAAGWCSDQPAASPALNAVGSAIPAPAINTQAETVKKVLQTIETTDKFDNVKNAIDFFGAMGEVAHFSGVYSYSPASGASGGGLATHLIVWKIRTGETVEWQLGPAYVVGSCNQGLFHAAEIAVETKFLGDKVDQTWQKIPCIGKLPIIWKDMTVFVGGGYEFGAGKESPCISIGIGGIKWGK